MRAKSIPMISGTPFFSNTMRASSSTLLFDPYEIKGMNKH